MFCLLISCQENKTFRHPGQGYLLYKKAKNNRYLILRVNESYYGRVMPLN